jgi:glycosyltransferase involved in cell wall biosynthesis
MQNFEKKYTIVHFITALESGGAEKVLFDTVLGLKNKFNHKVIVLSKRGLYCKKIENIGVSVEKLSFRVFINFFTYKKNDSLIHSYLDHSHIVSLFFRVMGFKVIWCMHGSIEKKVSFKTRIGGWISNIVPEKIVYVSRLARDQHINAGFTSRKISIIYNGVDSDKFNGNICNIQDTIKSGIKIAMIARYHPIKDYLRFMSIASMVLKIEDSCCFYLIGKGNSIDNFELLGLIQDNNLKDHVTLLGEVDDIHKIIPCFDLVVSTSKSESFGLTILESILSGVNISTINLPIMNELFAEYSPNSGDIADQEIAREWIRRCKISPSSEIMKLVKDNYSINRMIQSYKKIYLDIFLNSSKK